MSQSIGRLVVLSLAASVGQVAAQSIAPLDSKPTLFHDVNVVDLGDLHHGRVLEHRVVRIRDGKIEAIEAIDADLARDPGDARVVEGRGVLYLMPGLVDMHLHLPPDDGAAEGPGRRALALLLANGVTTVRGMAGHAKQLTLRERVRTGEVLGPTLYLAGPALHHLSVKSVDAAIQAVRDQKKAGFDLVKSHHIVDPEVYAAIQETAREVDLPVAGHVTNEVGLQRALDARMQFEHLDGFVPALMKEGYSGESFGQFPTMAALERVDLERLPPLATRFAAEKVPNTPTLALFEGICDGTTPTAALAARPEMKYLSKSALAKWSAERDQRMAAGFPPADMGKAFVALRQAAVRALRDAGAPLMVGSDCPQDFFIEGFATHTEIAALVNAGLTPSEALIAATATPAAYLDALPGHGSATGVAADFGSIAPGRRADLVLLAANPLADIANTRKIEGVMLRGRFLDRQELDGLLELAAAMSAQ